MAPVVSIAASDKIVLDQFLKPLLVGFSEPCCTAADVAPKSPNSGEDLNDEVPTSIEVSSADSIVSDLDSSVGDGSECSDSCEETHDGLLEAQCNMYKNEGHFDFSVGRWVAAENGSSSRPPYTEPLSPFLVIIEFLPVSCNLLKMLDTLDMCYLQAACSTLRGLSALPKLDRKMRRLLERIDDKFAEARREGIRGTVGLQLQLTQAVLPVLKSSCRCEHLQIPSKPTLASVQHFHFVGGHLASGPAPALFCDVLEDQYAEWSRAVEEGLDKAEAKGEPDRRPVLQAFAMIRRLRQLALEKQKRMQACEDEPAFQMTEWQCNASEDELSVVSDVSSTI